MFDLYCADSYEFIKTIPDKSVDLVVTDPPYLIENTTVGSEKWEKILHIQNTFTQLKEGVFTEGVTKEILKEFVRILKKINIYIWCNHKQIPDYIDFFVKENNCAFDILIWNKTNALPTFNNKYLTDKEYCLYFRKGGYCNPENYERAKTVYYQPINLTDKKLYEHPTIKPLNIIENLILNSSKEGDVVFDPFMGSGTTGVACKLHKRNFIGCEINPDYFKICEERINGTSIKKSNNMLF